jgi:hypothetical protein
MCSQDKGFEMNVHWGGRACLHVSGKMPLNIFRLRSVLGTISVIPVHFLTFSVYLLRVFLFLSFLLPFFSACIYLFSFHVPSFFLSFYYLSFNPLVLHLFTSFFPFRQYFLLYFHSPFLSFFHSA